MINVGIIGCGFVGGALKDQLEHNNPECTDAQLRNLVEEYITQQKSEFTLKGVCSYILYWAVEDGKVSDGHNLIESYDIQSGDQVRVINILDAIIADGRITAIQPASYVKNDRK